ncbi:MAG: hypothetical protein ABJA33_11330 [Pedococcus sp.]
MTVHVLGSAIVRTSPGVGDWSVWAVEHPAGIARVENRGGLTEVVVGDAPRSIDADDPGFTAVACTIDGGAFVLCHDAPPALVVGPHGCRTAPSEPGGRELLNLAPDERLLLLSSSVLDARPQVLAKALHSPGDGLFQRDPVDLLATLFREVHYGGGAVIGRAQPVVQPEG